MNSERLDYEQAWDFRLVLEHVHAPSLAARSPRRDSRGRGAAQMTVQSVTNSRSRALSMTRRARDRQ